MKDRDEIQGRAIRLRPSHADPRAGRETGSSQSAADAALPRVSGWTATRLFLAAFCGYMVFFGGHYVTGDNAQRIAWAKAIIDHGSSDISATFPGLHHTEYGVGATLLHIPFLIGARGLKRLTGISCEGPVGMLLYALNAALGLVLIFAILIARGGIRRDAAFMRALAIGFATVWLPYSKVDYSETLAAVALLGTFCLAEPRPLMAGLCGAIAIILRTDSLPWLILTAIFATSDRRALFRIGAGAILGLVVTFWANFVRTGNLLDSGYEVNFTTPLMTGVYGLLFSAGKSVLLFSPLLLFYPLAVADLWHSERGRRIAGWSIALVAGQLCFYGKWWDWSGDDSWGPRLIVYATLAALTVVMASEVPRKKIFKLAVIAGFCLQLPPVLIGPHASLMIDHMRTATVAGFAVSGTAGGTARPLTLGDIRFDPAYSQVTNTANLLLLKFAPHAQSLRQTAWLQGLNPPLSPDQVPFDIFWVNLHQRPR